MPSWVLKAIAHRAIGTLPKAEFWSEALKRQFGGRAALRPAFFASHLATANIHLDHFECHSGFRRPPIGVVDLGTGWFPIVPIALWLSGAEHVQTFDIAERITPCRLESLVAAFSAAAESGMLAEHLPRLRQSRLERLVSVIQRGEFSTGTEFLSQLGIAYRIGDFSCAPLPSSSVDLIVSFAVLECVPRDALRSILAAFRRVARAEAIMSHWIDLSDEYSYFDKGISRLNFLRFSDRNWQWINNPLAHHNRLRIGAFRQMFDEAGFSVVEEIAARIDPKELARIPLAPEFVEHPIDDLRILDAWLVAAIAEQAHTGMRTNGILADTSRRSTPP